MVEQVIEIIDVELFNLQGYRWKLDSVIFSENACQNERCCCCSFYNTKVFCIQSLIFFKNYLLYLIYRGRVGGVVQWWGGDWTGNVFRPRGSEGAAPRGAPLPLVTSAQSAAHGRGNSARCWCSCSQWGRRGKNAAHTGCHGGEMLCLFFFWPQISDKLTPFL